MIVAVSVALPKLVSVAEPERSPPKVIVGSDVAVVLMVMLPEPSKLALPVTAPDTAMLRAVVSAAAEVAVVALPLKAAVIVPAEKLPDASRKTVVLPVLRFVALDVTVNVPPSELTEPEIPLPIVAPEPT